MTDKLNGIFPPLVTPFEKNEISFEKLKRNLSLLEKSGLSGYVVLGSNGESAFLTRKEKIEIISFVRINTDKEKLLIAGTGSDSIKETISLTNEAADNGADFALVITPSFFKNEMNGRILFNYYSTVADNVKIPVIIYNVPKFTNVMIETETVIKLSEEPNITGLKDSTENVSRLSEIISSTDKSFKCLSGTASVLLPSLSAGAAGGILALANVAPEKCLSIYDLYINGNFVEALNLQNKLIPVNKAITSKYGVAGLKAAMDFVGFEGGVPGMPLEPLNDTQLSDLKSTLKKAELIN